MSWTWFLLGLFALAYGFFMQRKQDELAEKMARHLCKQQQLQFLECARERHHLSKFQQRTRWTTSYKIDFSSDGESRYQGELRLSGLRYLSLDLPPYRI